MSTDKIARRYAQAWFLTAREKQALPGLMADVAVVREAYRGVPELAPALANPRLSSLQKQAVVEALFRGHVSEGTLAFLRFLGHKNRVPLLAEICATVDEIYREAEGIVDATVHSARALGPKEKTEMQQHLNRRTGKTVNLACDEDGSLLGGFKVVFPDFVLDCSVSHQLETLHTLLANP